MGSQAARKDPPRPELPPVAPSGLARATGAMPLDPLIAVLSRAAERSAPAAADSPPSKASG